MRQPQLEVVLAVLLGRVLVDANGAEEVAVELWVVAAAGGHHLLPVDAKGCAGDEPIVEPGACLVEPELLAEPAVVAAAAVE